MDDNHRPVIDPSASRFTARASNASAPGSVLQMSTRSASQGGTVR
jgi:hypothetical protein